jgi:lysine decarboxylase
MAHGVTPEAFAAALDADPEARAAFVVSPTYYGMCADVEALARVAHERDVALVVDQSWGPHFGFHPDLPASALSLGADAALTSTHKIVGSLTQSALLHVAGTGRIDPKAVGRAIRLVRSTSPSSLLMASLDGTRRQLAVHGEALLHETIAAAAQTRAKLETTPGIKCIADDFVGRPGVADYDPLRLVLDTRGTGCTGYEVAEALRNAYDVQPELATVATLVCVLGVNQPAEALVRFAGDVDEIVKRIARPGAPSIEALVRTPAAMENEMVVPPREAFLGCAEILPVDESVGRVSCESIAGYPPGIPALLPGERLTADTVAYLKELVASGARLHGAADPTMATIHVLAQD